MDETFNISWHYLSSAGASLVAGCIGVLCLWRSGCHRRPRKTGPISDIKVQNCFAFSVGFYTSCIFVIGIFFLKKSIADIIDGGPEEGKLDWLFVTLAVSLFIALIKLCEEKNSPPDLSKVGSGPSEC
jgi:hypothetical protein